MPTLALEARLRELKALGRRVALCAVPHFLWTDGAGPIDLKSLREARDQAVLEVID